MLRQLFTSHPKTLPRFLYRGGPEPPLNEPTGYLFNEKPPPKGYRRVREDWELPYYFFMYGGFGLLAVGLYFKPDTRIRTWAKKEAARRMAERGEFQDEY